jgi:2,4-dienoyl-CoA reductase-like NADH-dependent reductase (Old Yellow Enzyme family)
LERHVGRVSVPSQIKGAHPLAATVVPLPGTHLLFGAENGEEPYVPSEAMSRETIYRVISQFARAAKNAIDAGFDGVEIHGKVEGLISSCIYRILITR